MGAVALGERPLLIDTAAFIFWHADSPRLSARARAALLQSLSRRIYVSSVTAFEIATKVRLGKLQVPAALVSDFQYVVEADGFRLVELDAVAAIRAGQFPSAHRDPFDRLLAAQALHLDCAAVTPDAVFQAAFGVEVLW